MKSIEVQLRQITNPDLFSLKQKGLKICRFKEEKKKKKKKLGKEFLYALDEIS